MASPNVGEIVTTTIQNRSRELADNVTNNNAILYYLSKRDGGMRTLDGGEKIYQELQFAENTNAQSYDGYDTLATAAQTVLDTAEFAWKQYAVGVVISGREKRQNSGRERMINLINSRILNAKGSIKNLICRDIYLDGTGNGGKALTGLASLIPTDPTTGTVGGINRANFTFWRSQIYQPNPVATIATIKDAMNNTWVKTIRDTDKPKLIIFDNNLYVMYQGSLQDQQRFSNTKLAEAGFENLKYNTAEVVLDGGIGGNCPANTGFFLNPDFLHWCAHSDMNFAPVSPESRDPVNQDATVRYIGFMGNLSLSGSQFNARLNNN